MDFFFFFFLPIEVFFTSLKLYHCISNEREYLNAMTTIQFQEGQNTFCRQDLFLIQHLWSEWIIMEYCFFSNGKNSNFLLESMQTTALNPQCLWKLMRFGSVRIGNVQDVWVGRMWPQTHTGFSVAPWSVFWGYYRRCSIKTNCQRVLSTETPPWEATFSFMKWRFQPISQTFGSKCWIWTCMVFSEVIWINFKSIYILLQE